jgi:hypothetical protein
VLAPSLPKIDRINTLRVVRRAAHVVDEPTHLVMAAEIGVAIRHVEGRDATAASGDRLRNGPHRSAARHIADDRDDAVVRLQSLDELKGLLVREIVAKNPTGRSSEGPGKRRQARADDPQERPSTTTSLARRDSR